LLNAADVIEMFAERMHRLMRILALGVVVLGVLAVPGARASLEEIRPPFGFQWGESSERLERMLKEAKARVVKKENIDGGERLTVEGITQRLLVRSYFIFSDDSLTEIELIYGDPAWDSKQYTDFFDQTRRHIDRRYGSGRLVARTKSTQNGVTHTLIGYQWTQVGATLQLFLFTAEKGTQTTRTLSLHYRSS
jgi:hypothetical protein